MVENLKANERPENTRECRVYRDVPEAQKLDISGSFQILVLTAGVLIGLQFGPRVFCYILREIYFGAQKPCPSPTLLGLQVPSFLQALSVKI
jgi:hypothetical protein